MRVLPWRSDRVNHGYPLPRRTSWRQVLRAKGEELSSVGEDVRQRVSSARDMAEESILIFLLSLCTIFEFERTDDTHIHISVPRSL